VKRVLLLFTYVVLVTTISASMIPKIFAGFSNTWVSADKWLVKEPEGVTGFMIGVALEVDQGSPFIMEYGGRYRTAGAELNMKQSGEAVDMSLDLNYIDIFAKAKYEFPMSSSWYLIPYTGYAMGFLLSADEKFTVTSGGQHMSLTIDVSGDCSTLNHSLLFGTDIVIADRFLLGIEYDLGLSNVWSYKAKDEDLLNDHGLFGYMCKSDMTTSALMFKAGIFF